MTPEGRVKKQVKKILGAFWGVYVEMPVPGGYGKSGLDFNCIVNGYALVIETKAPGKWLTGRQRETARQIFVAGGAVFFISNNDGLRALLKWMLAHALKKELE
jgi:hypothetical protein